MVRNWNYTYTNNLVLWISAEGFTEDQQTSNSDIIEIKVNSKQSIALMSQHIMSCHDPSLITYIICTVDKYKIYLPIIIIIIGSEGSIEQCEVFEGPKEDIKVPH